MSLSVLNVAYPLAAVSVDAVGGSEQVLSCIDAALVAKGHRSIVIACEGSRVAGRLHAIPAHAGEIDDEVRRAAHRAVRAAIEHVVREERVDVIHLHGIDFTNYLPAEGPPVLATLHLPPSWYPAEALTPTRPRTWVHCVSRSQHAQCPRSDRLLPPVPNGVPVQRFRAGGRRRQGALALGRICPEKGFHHALDAAHRAGIPLTLGGSVFHYPAHEQYFREEIVPRLDHTRRFVGPLTFAAKRRLLASSRCVLVPSLAPETSSLVTMEALASGTPVIAFPAGALAELIDSGHTGFLVRSADEMAEAIACVGEIEGETCRRVAEERFSAQRMTDRYVALYDTLRREV
jgi:glycosyltransferase involved in cell wall biosynthesis